MQLNERAARDLPRVLVVEDDPEVARIIERILTEFDFDPVCCRNAREMLKKLPTANPAVCLVDLGLPDMDGMEVMQRIRAISRCGIVIVTGRSDVSDRVMGLELGADDYVTKPFEPRELVARIRSVLRRREASGQSGEGGKAQVAHFAGWRFLPNTNTLVSATGQETLLSAAESELLQLFLQQPNRILQREQLIGRNLSPNDRSIDVRISRLRRKLEPDADCPNLIKTVYGAGYLFLGKVSWQAEG